MLIRSSLNRAKIIRRVSTDSRRSLALLPRIVFRIINYRRWEKKFRSDLAIGGKRVPLERRRRLSLGEARPAVEMDVALADGAALVSPHSGATAGPPEPIILSHNSVVQRCGRSVAPCSISGLSPEMRFRVCGRVGIRPRLVRCSPDPVRRPRDRIRSAWSWTISGRRAVSTTGTYRSIRFSFAEWKTRVALSRPRAIVSRHGAAATSTSAKRGCILSRKLRSVKRATLSYARPARIKGRYARSADGDRLTAAPRREGSLLEAERRGIPTSSGEEMRDRQDEST